MSSTPRIGVTTVVVSFNNWPHVALAIESALSQMEGVGGEVIVADDGSSDGRAELVRSRFGERVSVVEVKRDATYDWAVNVALRRAVGEFVQILDGDDCLGPGKVHLQLDHLRRHAAVDIAYGEVLPFFSSVEDALRIESRRTQQHTDMLLALCVAFDNLPGPGAV